MSSRPIASVHIEIAEFMARVADVTPAIGESLEAARANWLMNFARALSYRDPSLHPYAAQLLNEAKAFSEAKARAGRSGAAVTNGKGRQSRSSAAAKVGKGRRTHGQTDSQTDQGRRSDPVQGEGSRINGSTTTRGHA